jgi:hypothetical protein
LNQPDSRERPAIFKIIMKHESEYMRQRRERMLGIKPPEEKAVKPIAKKSAKRKTEEKEYKKIVAEMLKADKRCELLTPACTKVAQGLHHMKKRGANYLDRKYLKRACNACNVYVEQHPQYALDNGLSLSVHKIQS